MGFWSIGSRVDVVNADEVVLDEDFSILWLGNGYIGLVLQDVNATCLLNQDCFHGLW